jgi:hypothetical protein
MRDTCVALSSLLLGCSAASATSTTGKAAHGFSAAEPGRTPNDSTSQDNPGLPASETSSGTRSEPPEAKDEAARARPAEPPPLPDGTVVLHVGSSTALALGRYLAKELEASGTKYFVHGKESTFIPQWAGASMGLAKLVATYNPDLVLVSLGGNETGIPNPGNRAGAIQRIVKIIDNRPCVWIGTPEWKSIPQTGIHDVIRENCAPCLYIDTDALVPDLQPLGDGVHPTFPERQRWAERVVHWLRHNRDPDGDRPWAFKDEIELPPEK